MDVIRHGQVVSEWHLIWIQNGGLAMSLAGIMFLVSVAGINCTENGPEASADVSSAVVHVTAAPDWVELELWGFRVWMIIGLILIGIMIVVVALCCIFDCRIPRTKQDIQARVEKQQAAKRKQQQKQQQQQQQQSRNEKKPERQEEPPRVTLGAPRNRSALSREEPDSKRSRRFQNSEIDNPAIEATPSEPCASHVTGNFELEEKHYGKRLVYIPGKGIEEQKTDVRQFRREPLSATRSLSSLHEQRYSRV